MPLLKGPEQLDLYELGSARCLRALDLLMNGTPGGKSVQSAVKSNISLYYTQA